MNISSCVIYLTLIVECVGKEVHCKLKKCVVHTKMSLYTYFFPKSVYRDIFVCLAHFVFFTVYKMPHAEMLQDLSNIMVLSLN